MGVRFEKIKSRREYRCSFKRLVKISAKVNLSLNNILLNKADIKRYKIVRRMMMCGNKNVANSTSSSRGNRNDNEHGCR